MAKLSDGARESRRTGRTSRRDRTEDEPPSVGEADAAESRPTRSPDAVGITPTERTALGALCWVVGRLASLTPRGFVVGIPAVALGAYLVLYPSRSR